jgi:predicted nucleic acid binding AN1-type Zn finger protein
MAIGGNMSNCAFCGDKIIMSFVCKECGGVFCHKHKLPESHGHIYVNKCIETPTGYIRKTPVDRVNDAMERWANGR